MIPVAIAASLACACSSSNSHIPVDPVTFHAPDAAAVVPALATYRLSTGDVLSLRVYELDAMTGDQIVDTAGHISLPLIGPVAAGGLTLDQLEQEIVQRLQKSYLQSPHVVVTLKAAVQRTVTVDGAVKMPGIYAIATTATLSQSVALAHGASSVANVRRVVVFRQINGHRAAAAFDLKTISNGKDPDPTIYPNDVIVVDGSGLSAAYQSVLRSVPLANLFRRF